ncbi:MAG: hypothetical protein AB7T06_30540 [Kofleriaceae bacterium]
MLWFRSIVVGLLGACAILLAQAANRPVIVQAAVSTNHATIIDVAPGVDDVIPLLGLAPGEHVLSVGDRTVLTDLEAGAAIRDTRQAPGHYVDLTTTQRRVLVLLH